MSVSHDDIDAVATFYDMLDTQPVGRRRVYVCTNISCSLCGGRELLGALQEAVGEDPGVHVRGFECLGACDIAPMVSVDGVYVGPVTGDDVAELARQITTEAITATRSAVSPARTAWRVCRTATLPK